MSDPIRILFLSADPTATLDTNLEFRRVYEAVQGLPGIEILSRDHVHAGDLQRILREIMPHVLHFAGHGAAGRGALVTQHPQGGGQLLEVGALAAMLAAGHIPTRLVVLNACWSLEAAQEFHGVADAVVGMSGEVDDRSAAAFAAGFYLDLCRGGNLQNALDTGRAQIRAFGLPDAPAFQVLLRNELKAERFVLHPVSVQALTALPSPSAAPRLRGHAFVSYAHADREFVERLVGDLRKRGYLMWIDSDGIRGGDVWRQAISDGIATAAVVLLMVSHTSLQSEWVRIEVAGARQFNKKIVPLLLHTLDDESDRTAYQNLGLEPLQYIDFSKHYAQGLRALQRPDVLPSPESASRDRRLEAAMPKQTRARARTEVWVKIVLPESLGLKNELPAMVESGDIIEKSDVRGSSFTIQFVRNREGDLLPVKVCLEVKSPDFEVSFDRARSRVCEDQQTESELQPDRDSRTFAFYLTPHAELLGRARVNVGLYRQGLKISEVSVSTDVVEKVEKIDWAVFTAAIRAVGQAGTLVGAVDAEGMEQRAMLTQREPMYRDQPALALARLSTGFDLPLLEWYEIPEGSVEMGHERTIVPAFWIAKYPVTNAQFQAFIDAPDGYRNPVWWDGRHSDGLEQQQFGPRRSFFDGANHPRTDVSWYEAMAFSRWLASKTGLPITLPTEAQWQRAAQGDDGREYPWGNAFDKDRCNTWESGFGKTTPVDQYPNGASPFGVMDMSGNVWEWCLNEYEGGKENMGSNANRALRGGSWYFSPFDARAAARFRLNPHFRFGHVGCRLGVVVLRPPSHGD